MKPELIKWLEDSRMTEELVAWLEDKKWYPDGTAWDDAHVAYKLNALIDDLIYKLMVKK